jgi:reversibly glycosylated polypeptide/UDP-arabinopyranose mutase
VNTLVVPSNSPERVSAFLEAWSPWPWDRVIIVRDGPEVDLALPDSIAAQAAKKLDAYSWAEIDALVPDPAIISRRDSAIRSFGFWRAWLDGAEVIHTLDDDCFPSDEGIVDLHHANLFGTPAWTTTVPGMRVRGLPYRNTGVLTNVLVSMGLWRGSPDLDAITTLSEGASIAEIGDIDTRVMPSTQYFPLSGMNLAFRREAAPLMYFAPMGEGQPYGRFDDIWCGLTLQRVCRHLGASLTCGRPLVHHQRASDPWVNLVKEAPGVVANEKVWETLDAIELTATAPRECMAEVGAGLAANDDEYVAGWGRSIVSWCGLFDLIGEPAETRAES